MRSITVMLSTLMFIVLIISTYIYEKQDPVSLPQPIQRTDSLEQEPESLKPTTNETISYTLQKNELNITYNEGNDWMKVPIDTESLFQGE
jgi:biopolymer transport protein ExbD